MADQDDGLELNLDLSTGPGAAGAGAAIKRAKVAGGRWKDRVRVRRAENRQIRRRERLISAATDDGQASRPNAASTKSGDATTTQSDATAARPIAAGTDGVNVGVETASRGQKRKRDADRLTLTGVPTADGAVSKPTGAPKQVISSLFNFHEDRLPNVAPTLKRAPAREAAAVATNAPLADIASFDDAGLPEDLLALLKDKMGVTAPTLIQQRALPWLLHGGGDADVFLRAQTGSGKTLAYLLPILARLARLPEQHRVRAAGTFCLIVAPTRELAGQIYSVLVKACNCRSLRWIVPCLLVGGERKKSEKARLRKGATIVIATPGRLKDHLDTTRALDVAKVAFAVLDEADRLMDLGFEQTVKDILAAIDGRRQHNRMLEDVLPKRRVTILCSATSKGQLGDFGKALLSDAVLIEGDDREASSAQADATLIADSKADAVARSSTGGGSGSEHESIPAQLRQEFITVPTKLRTVTLVALLRNAFPQCKRVIVFLSCADSVDWHFEALSRVSPGSGPAAAAATPAGAASTDGQASPEAVKAVKTRDEADLACTVATAACVREGMEVYRLHGSLPQAVRRATLHRFASASAAGGAVLLSTDVASRGLDTDCDLVVQLDPPFALGDYVHRVGRTARAGRVGRAVLVLLKTEAGYIDYLKSKLSQQQAPSDTTTGAGASASGSAGVMQLTEINARSALRQAFGGKAFEEEATKWQLDYEKYVLTPASSLSASSSQSASSKGGKSKGRPDPKEKIITETAASNRAARAFTSHVRAYATHVAHERRYFPLHELQLGHVAKCFGLREAPSRLAAVAGAGGGKSANKRKHNPGAVDDRETAAERMRKKMSALRSGAGGGADEYNLY